ncbi:group III truncated hemoglobin [Flectobacillus roseus]|jgi:hemoglobin|uniref:Group III truncated hemoglobin n=1 Tax=Flectobacillus roseus TaxID=502259 RepID=A0ABT6Y3M4_9BACT|nr:group III truncated hemoglobin [Flectobacillus roseus]MDI9858121.1 group III truncated hemoglobin [Flectobacillus roseus]
MNPEQHIETNTPIPIAKKALEGREDVELLVNTFYDKVRDNQMLGHIFDHVARVNWQKHLPKMYNFWEMILFGTEGYDGHPLRPHFVINSVHQLTIPHFEQWLSLFFQTLDELFEGEKAEEAKQRAYNIANAWAHKIDYMNKLNDSPTIEVSQS